jgi:KDO2-lipid IV(A) lauroyltransferase
MLHVAGGNAGEARRLARASFANYAVYLVDFLRFTDIDGEGVRDRVEFDQWHILDEQRAGKGIIFITLHYGLWDLGAAALVTSGYPLSVIADTFPDPRLNELVLGTRRKLGMEVVPAERMGPGILRALRRNDVVALLIDVPQHGSGVEVEFFGDTIAVSDGPARIALRAGANVVAATLPRVDPWRDHMTGHIEPVPFVPSGDRECDVQALTQATMQALERLVRRHPEQWYIFRNLWVKDAARVAV